MTLADKTTSRVTVGPSGRFVYLTAKNEGLVAINAQTGENLVKLLSLIRMRWRRPIILHSTPPS